MSVRTGLLTELRGANYLRKYGYRVVRIRWRGHAYEVDIIAEDRGETVFVEVKAADALTKGGQRVDRMKQTRLMQAAQEYMTLTGACHVRFDVLEESPAGFLLIQDAF